MTTFVAAADSSWDPLMEACRRLSGRNLSLLWRRVGKHSGTMSFGLGVPGRRCGELVVQVFDPGLLEYVPTNYHEKLGIVQRYTILGRLAALHQEGDGCRFIKPVACFPEWGGIAVHYAPGDDLWSLLRRRCVRWRWNGLDAVIRHVRNLAVWTGRVDQATRQAGTNGREVDASRQITEHKLLRIADIGVLVEEEKGQALARLHALARRLLAEQPYTVLAHGDLCPANVLVDGSSAHIIDIHSAHRALAFEDAAYFLTTLDSLLIEPLRYVPERVRRLKDTFLETYESFVAVSPTLMEFQFLTSQVQMLNYYTSVWNGSSGIRRLLNAWRVAHYRDQVRALVRGDRPRLCP